MNNKHICILNVCYMFFIIQCLPHPLQYELTQCFCVSIAYTHIVSHIIVVMYECLLAIGQYVSYWWQLNTSTYTGFYWTKLALKNYYIALQRRIFHVEGWTIVKNERKINALFLFPVLRILNSNILNKDK